MATEAERISRLENEREHTQRQFDLMNRRIEALPELLSKVVSEAIAHCRQTSPEFKDPGKGYSAKVGWTLAIFQGLWLFAQSKGWV